MTYMLTMHEDTGPKTEPISTNSQFVQLEGGYTAEILQWSYPAQGTEGAPRVSAAVAKAKPTEVLGHGREVHDFHSDVATLMAFL